MHISANDYDEMLAVIDAIKGIKPIYPSMKDLMEFLEDVDKMDIKYLMWLDENLPDPETEEQREIRHIINTYLMHNLIIVEPKRKETKQ